MGMVQYCFTSTETVRHVRTGPQDGHHDFHTAPELCYTAVAAAVVLLNVLGCRLT